MSGKWFKWYVNDVHRGKKTAWEERMGASMEHNIAASFDETSMSQQTGSAAELRENKQIIN